MINSKEELPKKWVIKITPENTEVLHDYRKIAYKDPLYNTTECPNYYMNEKGMGCMRSDGLEITFEEFKKYVLNIQLDNNNMETTKKIIGYKLVKPEYEKAFQKITNVECDFKNNLSGGCCFNYDTPYTKQAVKAGVLDLWFEPVYEKQEKVINMGSFNLTVKSEGIFHSNENITQFVESLYKFYSALPSKFGSFDCIVDEIIFKKCGCESNKTFAKQWLAVWEEYIKIKQ